MRQLGHRAVALLVDAVCAAVGECLPGWMAVIG
jgi:hypothetical protein